MNLYSFHINDEEYCEFDKFINRFQIEKPENEDQEKHNENCGTILAAIGEFTKRGAERKKFRFENNVHALPIENADLRLYCIMLNNGAVLLGNGGIKTARTFQESPDCKPHQELMSVLEKAITDKVQEGEIHWNGDKLAGNMDFSLGDCED